MDIVGGNYIAMKNSDILRWILLVPLTLGGAFLVFQIGGGYFSDALMSGDPHVIWMYITGVSTSVATVCAWLYISYEVAPSHKSKVICISYIAGLMTMMLIFGGYIIRGLNGNITPPFIIICSGVFAGLGYTIYLFRKSGI